MEARAKYPVYSFFLPYSVEIGSLTKSYLVWILKIVELKLDRFLFQTDIEYIACMQHGNLLQILGLLNGPESQIKEKLCGVVLNDLISYLEH